MKDLVSFDNLLPFPLDIFRDFSRLEFVFKESFLACMALFAESFSGSLLSKIDFGCKGGGIDFSVLLTLVELYTTAAGLQEEFLQRPGKLTPGKEFNKLQVEAKTLDILLDRLPWNISLIKLPWMDKMLHVEWR